MASTTNTTTFGASIVPIDQLNLTTTNDNRLPQLSVFDTPASTPAASHEDLSRTTTTAATTPTRHTNYSSPFSPQRLSPTHPRQHGRPEYLDNEKSTYTYASTDLEACTPVRSYSTQTPADTADDTTTALNPFTSKRSVEYNKEDAMWPSRQTLLTKQAAEAKKQRQSRWCGGCIAPVRERWGGLSKRQRIGVRVFVAMVVVGVMVAIALGITVAVDGTVYTGEESSRKIPAAGR